MPRRMRALWTHGALVMLSFTASYSAHAAGVNFSWNDCGPAGTPFRTFACNTNTGTPFTAIASFVPPGGVTELVGVQADVRIVSSDAALPDWWKHGTGECRGTTGLSTSFDFTGGPFTCADFFAGQAAGGFSYEIGSYGANTARLHVSCSVPSANRGPVDSTSEYYAFKINLLRSKTVNAGSCPGCSAPVSLTLDTLRLIQAAEVGFDPALTQALHSRTVYWQGGPRITSFAPTAGVPGTTVQIEGSKLTNAVSVTFGQQASAYSVVSDEIVMAIAPAGVRTAPLVVQTTEGVATSDSLFIAAPKIARFSPPRAPVGHSFQIVGVNFTRTSAVAIGDKPAPFQAVSDTLIRAWVPAAAQDASVIVTNPGGADTTETVFQVGPIDSVATAAINLAWNDCGATGAKVKSFDCLSNSGSPATAIGSFLPPAYVNEFVGFEAQLRITSNSTNLPDWWKFGTGSCRGSTGMSTSFDFSSGPFACVDFSTERAISGGYAYTVGWYGPNTARLVVTCSIAEADRFALDPTLEYYGFKMNLLRSNTVGVAACAGCTVPVSLLFEQLQLFQPDTLGENPIVASTRDGNLVFWQRSLPPGPYITGFEPAAGPVGSTVELRGLGFGGTSRVRFEEGVASFSVESDSVIHAIVPEAGRTGHLWVENAHGEGYSDSEFVIGPQVSSFVPAQAPVSHPVRISGKYFLRTTSVQIANLEASFVFVSDSVLHATIPQGASDGRIRVANAGGSDLSAEILHVGPLVDVPEPAPLSLTLSSAEPNPSSGDIRWWLSLPGTRRVRATVFDAFGARVASVVNADWSAGRHPILWDGRTSRGTQAGAGMYFLHVQVGGTTLERPAVIVR